MTSSAMLGFGMAISQQQVTGGGGGGGPITLTSGEFISTPDSAGVSVTGDIDIRIIADLDDITPAAYVDLVSHYGSNGNRAWTFRLQTTGRLSLFWYENGSTLQAANGTTSIGASSNGYRVTLDVSTGDVTYYTTDDSGGTWDQLGAVASHAATSIFDSSADLKVGSGHVTRFVGDVYKVELYDGIDGTLVASMDADDRSGSSWTSSATGETWTLE